MSVPKRDSRITNPFGRFENSFPRIPQAVLDQYPELRDWQDELDTWFENLRQTIEDNQDVLLAKIRELE